MYDVCYRRDTDARSGELADDHRDAEVPHTETSSHTEVSEDDAGDAVVPSQPDSQSQFNVIYYTFMFVTSKCTSVCVPMITVLTNPSKYNIIA